MEKDYQIRYRFPKRSNGERNSFAEQDVFNLLNDVDEILSIESCTVNGKSQTGAVEFGPLKDLCDSYEDRLILFTSGALKSEYPEEPKAEEMTTILGEQEKFLLKNGFVSINDYVGYESRRAYIYNNKLGKKLLERLAG